ncbi:GNAT family N-acetyltransferase [Thalassotalea euphylliae]|uniref:GNAT family N-acetyltransferase n=1 Tax=Thalassotalea euphylliae TaxID=1655234 RepID=UPI0036377E7F
MNGVTFLECNDKKLWQPFYKAQKYRATLKGYDRVFAAYLSGSLIACVITSRLFKNSPHLLLHGLVVATNHQHKGVGHHLTRYALQQVSEEPDIKDITCFCDAALAGFYHALGFEPILPSNLTTELTGRFKTYQRYQASLVALQLNLQ